MPLGAGGGSGEALPREAQRMRSKGTINRISADLIVKRHADSEEFEKGTKSKHSEM